MAERTFGLVIGIDDYAFVPDLQGAVNDAEDIADALVDLGAEVTLLTDARATRTAILSAWETILANAQNGDRLIVSYAGHGSHEPEHTPGNEADGRDENFLLAGFAPRGPAAAERIRDDEIAELVARSAALDVIFVADACHAGTVTRDLTPVLGYRYVSAERLVEDPLPPPPPPSSGSELANMALFLAAVNEAEKVPEVLIDGTPRGALSFAFADGLRGAADINGDALITKGELELHVRRTVRQISDGAQLPQSEPAGQENRALISLRGSISDTEIEPETVTVSANSATEFERVFADLPLLKVTGPGWERITGVSLSSMATLRRDSFGSVLSSIGDKVAFAVDRQSLQSVADKHRLVDALKQIAHPSLGVRFNLGDRTYTNGQRLEIRINGRRTSYLTLINLAADGTISLLYPNTTFRDPRAIAPRDRIDLPVTVTPPFGADHVVAIETDNAPYAMRDALAKLDGTKDAASLWDVVRRNAVRLAVFPFFTTGDAL